MGWADAADLAVAVAARRWRGLGGTAPRLWRACRWHGACGGRHCRGGRYPLVCGGGTAGGTWAWASPYPGRWSVDVRASAVLDECAGSRRA